MNSIVKFDLWNVASYASLLFVCYQYQCLSSRVEWGRGGSSVSHRRISLKASVSKSEENGEKEVGIALIIYKRDSYPFLLFPRNKCYQASRRNATDDIDRTRQRKTHNQKQSSKALEWPLLWSSSTWPSAPSWPSSSAAASLAETESPSSSKTPGSCQEQQEVELETKVHLKVRNHGEGPY